MSYLEGVFSRGDRRLSKTIVKAWGKGCRFDEWEEGIKFDLWMETFQECGIDPKFYVERRRGQDEVLPWDHLFVEMKKDWLWEDYQESFHAGFIDDCSTGKCTICGVCDYKEIRNRAYELPVYDEGGKTVKKKTTTEIRAYQSHVEQSVPVGATHASPLRNVIFTYHCTFSKKGPAALLSHLELVEHIRRAVSRAELPVRFSEGFHPMPRISFGNGIAVGREVEAEPLTIELNQDLDPQEIQGRWNRELPNGIEIRSVVARVAAVPRPLLPPFVPVLESSGPLQ